MNISQEHFGKLSNGTSVDMIELQNDHKISIKILSYGGIIHSLLTPDLQGNFKDIVLGRDDIKGYEEDNNYLGAVVGPTAGRIHQGKFNIDDNEYLIDTNEGAHHLHGGQTGLSNKVWDFKTEKREGSVKLELFTSSFDTEGGYPGHRNFRTTYILNNKNQLMIYFDADTDKDTIINMTSHSYFNLSNEDDTILNQKIMINAQKTLSVNQALIPDGSFEYVLGKPTNFSRGAILEESIKRNNDGFDHVYVINKEYGAFGISAKAVDEKSGRTLDLVTDQPAAVFYTSNHFDGSAQGKDGKPLIKYAGFCLEPQHFPDAPNHPNFPCITLRARKKYKSRSMFTFGLTSDRHHD